MKTRPKYFEVLSLAFAFIAASIPIQIVFLYSHSLSELSLVLMKLSLLNLLLGCALFLNAYLLWVASPWLKVAVPCTLIILTWNNYVVGSFGQDYSLLSTSLATLTFMGICTPMLHSKYRKLLAQPQKRWWMTPKRICKSLPIQIQPHVGQNLLAESFDISESGVYVAFNSCISKTEAAKILDPKLSVGDLTTLQIRLSQFNTIKCEAKVVRKADSTSSHPAGMGLQFIGMGYVAKSQLRKYVSLEL